MYEACAVGPQIIFGFLVFWFLVFGFLIMSYPSLSSAVITLSVGGKVSTEQPIGRTFLRPSDADADVSYSAKCAESIE